MFELRDVLMLVAMLFGLGFNTWLVIRHITDRMDRGDQEAKERAEEVAADAAERETWAEQVEEAKAVQAGETDAPMLQAIADERGLTLTEIAQRVLDKRATYKAVVGPATGKRQKLEQQIDDAETVEELDGIEW